MGLSRKIRNSLCSLVAAVTIGSCSNSCEETGNSRNKRGVAIMITGNDLRSKSDDAFRHSNRILSEHFSRSFNVHEFYTGSGNEKELYKMIKAATRSNNQLIISYSGHGALDKVEMVDGRILDAMYFPSFMVRDALSSSRDDNTRKSLRLNVRYVNNTLPNREISIGDSAIFYELLDNLDVLRSNLNLEYAQFYNPNDNRIFPQEIMLLLNNYHGKIVFITNSCYSGQVNDLVKRDNSIMAAAFASSPYNEKSLFDVGEYSLFGRTDGFYLSRELAARFNNSKRTLINLANERPDLADFIWHARNITGHRFNRSSRYNLRDEGFNFQRFSRINEFYF